MPELPSGRSASEARDRPERLLLSARGPGPARAPSAGKGRWGKGLLEAGRAGSTPTLQKVNAQANRMPRPPPKAAKTDRVLRPKGGLGNGAPTEGTPSARRGITVSVSVFQRSLSLYVHSLTSVSCLLSTLPFVSVGSTFALLTKASLPPTCCLAKKGNESLVTES